jgi:hypothetical protein
MVFPLGGVQWSELISPGLHAVGLGFLLGSSL